MDTQTNPAPASDEKIEHGAPQAATEASLAATGAAAKAPKAAANGKGLLEPEKKRAGKKTNAPTAKAKRAAEANASPTLEDVAQRYLDDLEKNGKSIGTVHSYSLELKLAIDALGANTPVDKITPKTVAAYFASNPVTRTRTGLPKSPLSIAKTERVLRQAMTFAENAGLVVKAPLPE